MFADLGYPMVDFDVHYYEPDDAFTRHLPAGLRGDALRVDRSRGGRVYLGKDRLGFFSVGVGDHVGPPGLLKQYFRGSGTFVMPNTDPVNGLAVPEYTQRPKRLEVMDAQGVQACLMLPTWGVGVEPELRAFPELLGPSIEAFNRWVEEDWGFDDGRIFGAGILSFANPEGAVVEVRRLAAAGCRAVCVTPGPVNGASPADPVFDPIWAALEETAMLVVHHIGANPLCEVYAAPWGERAHPPSHRHSALEMFLAFGERPVADTWAALILHNLFGRFPGLRVVSIENGGSWLPGLMSRLDKTARAGVNKDSWRFGTLDAAPSEILRRNFWIVPYYEDDVASIVAAMGPDRVLAGSDYPHPEGLADPREFLEEIDTLSAADQRCIMRNNGAGLLGVAP